MHDAESKRLQDVLEIMQLKSRYCRCVDLRQWDDFRRLFTEDARFEGFAAAPSGADVTTFVGGVARRLEGSVTVHHCHQPDIVLVGPDTARGTWAMMDYNEWPHAIGMPAAPNAQGFQGYGYYEEEYQRVQGEWKFRFIRLTRLRVDPLERPGPHPTLSTAEQSDWLRPSPDWLPQKG